MSSKQGNRKPNDKIDGITLSFWPNLESLWKKMTDLFDCLIDIHVCSKLPWLLIDVED